MTFKFALLVVKTLGYSYLISGEYQLSLRNIRHKINSAFFNLQAVLVRHTIPYRHNGVLRGFLLICFHIVR